MSISLGNWLESVFIQTEIIEEFEGEDENGR